MQVNDVLQDVAMISYLVLNLRIMLTHQVTDNFKWSQMFPHGSSCKMYGLEEQTKVHTHCRQGDSQMAEKLVSWTMQG